MNGTTISVSKLRQNAAKVIDEVNKSGNFFTIISRSEPKAIVADYEYFNALEEAVLDATDAKESDRAKKEPRTLLNSYIKKRWRNTNSL